LLKNNKINYKLEREKMKFERLTITKPGKNIFDEFSLSGSTNDFE
jgi:hypothetical protein